MLKLEHINLTFEQESALKQQVLSDINLDIKSGEFVVIIGGNGAGKSSLFNLISGALMPDSGHIFIADKEMTYISQRKRTKYISLVLQDPKIGTMEAMTIFENMSFALKRGAFRGLSLFNKASRRQRCFRQLKKLNMGLEDRMDVVVKTLSGGQRQALSLVMALMVNTKILLLDEITAALDPGSSEMIMQLTASIVTQEKLTCLMITHDMEHALHYGDRLLLLKEGHLIAEYNRAQKAQLSLQQLAAHFQRL